MSRDKPVPPCEEAIPTVELVHPSYQPTEKELDEPVRVPPNTSPEDIARALGRRVNIRYIRRPRR